MKIERPRGTRDFLPDEMEKRREIESIMRRIAEGYGYREICTPTFEHLELFTIKSGEGIVEEMYVFSDKAGRRLALRPELTAPVMRLFVNECSVMPKPLRFYYFANCFRYERPQRGRYREFWQFGVELIGSDSYLADVEVISLSYRILEALKIDFDLEIGHVGIMRTLLSDLSDEQASKIMRLIDKGEREELEEYMESINLDSDTQNRVLSLIEMRGGMDVLQEAKEIVEYDFDHLEKLGSTLEDLGVKFKFNLGIARGLDYYTGVVFECYASGLGAQKQICGGGSYELAHLFGGSRTPATGFAIGFDRVCELCDARKERLPIVVVVSFRGLESYAFKLAEKLREYGIVAIVDVMQRSVKKQLSYANDVKADYAVIIGEKEVKEGVVALKDLTSGDQKVLKLDDAIQIITTSPSRRRG